MSKFLSKRFKTLSPYTPGEQPKDEKYIKLNTNESPYPPSKKAIAAAKKAAKKLNLYPDPTALSLNRAFANEIGVKPDEVIATNGSDEILNFAFAAFCDKECGAAFPDITYGFYEVFAKLYNIPYTKIPLKEDFSIDINDYLGLGKTIFIANPNAPTGLALSLSQIEEILKANTKNIVVIDEAYVDFGAESAVCLINKYDNLLVTQTFSKSRSMAGARLGFGIANRELIKDLNTIKYSTNPYNINKMTMAAGIGTLIDAEYTKRNCQSIIKTREYAKSELLKLGFSVIPSSANFVFAKHAAVCGEKIYKELRQRKILVRRFDLPKICDYCRITIGTKKQTDALLRALKSILEENL